MSRRSMATLLMLGICLFAHARPAFAEAHSSTLRVNTVVRNAPTVPTSPGRPRGGRIQEGRVVRELPIPELNGTTQGLVRTVLRLMLH